MKYEQFESFLDDDLSWRKKEISDLFLVTKDIEYEAVLKAVILLLYAHWEGYIKKSSKLYLKYVSEKKITLNQLSRNFKATVMKNSINRCLDTTESLTLSNEIAFITKYMDLESKKFKIKVNVDDDQDRSVINTKSNLNPTVLKSIYKILGIKFKEPLVMRTKYIDTNLLFTRNTIGHGSRFDNDTVEGLTLSLIDIEKLKKVIFILIDNFRDELLEFAYCEYFLESNSDEKELYEDKKSKELEKELKLID